MTDCAPELTRHFVDKMNHHVHPDLVLTLGDMIEDACLADDRARYNECLETLAGLRAPVRHVVGNHDTINQSDDMIRDVWKHTGPLFYGFDFGGVHFSVLRTIERAHVDCRIDDEQIAWLREDLTRTNLPAVVAMHHAAAEQDLRHNPWFDEAPHLALVKGREALRDIIRRSGKVVLVLNGHLHWNHVDLHDGIPYVTVQSLTENLNVDEPGRPANGHAVIRMDERGLLVNIEGYARFGFQMHRGG
jgi:3',5'-cyclic AMP phosphodiesterase CpdA